jgi:hypothetical protein
MPDGRSFRSTAATVLVYAVAMAFLEAAVVVDLTLALGGHRRWPRPDRADPYRSASTTTRSPHVKEMRASRPGFRLTP